MCETGVNMSKCFDMHVTILLVYAHKKVQAFDNISYHLMPFFI